MCPVARSNAGGDLPESHLQIRRGEDRECILGGSRRDELEREDENSGQHAHRSNPTLTWVELVTTHTSSPTWSRLRSADLRAMIDRSS